MKVCTDACIFGAWFAQKDLPVQHILDIGSGTGLLMLMLAQKQKAIIHGIEIDDDCFEQLKQNIEESKWSERLKLHTGDIRNFNPGMQFDFIICNPPFHENNLQANSEASNAARHSSHLTFEELINSIDLHLSHNGSFAVLLPYYRMEYFHQLADATGFYLSEKLLVKQSPNHEYFRAILLFARNKTDNILENKLTIQDDNRQYTSSFISLLNQYYLYLD
jgi:tRNA1Val (adenine37-N6)-methyltransferase